MTIDDDDTLILKTKENVVSAERLRWYWAVLTLAEVLLVPADRWPVLLLMIAVTAGSSSAIYFFYVRPELQLGPTGVTVVNPFSRSEIAYQDLASCDGGSVLTLTDTSGRRISSWAIQGENIDV